MRGQGPVLYVYQLTSQRPGRVSVAEAKREAQVVTVHFAEQEKRAFEVVMTRRCTKSPFDVA